MKKMKAKKSEVKSYENYKELNTATLRDIEDLIISLGKQIRKDVSEEVASSLENVAHDFTTAFMETINGGTATYLESKEVDEDYSLACILFGIGIAGIDMIDTFMINLDKQGWLIKPSDREEKEENSCEGKCPFCGSPECEIVCEINDPEDPCVCKCGDCGEFWVTK